ncbi:MAG: CoA pyrophosphatase [Lunatimonas sp.]|uniref:NUDIX hydrolase n=1 Tax=Lunatimonas sp. TaxID=2060141 RepID=UPI00263AF61C|nr:CoA pyrophosphatase [Lunatimonas sp.]MCC5937503.1 CoA pyrophosphatase [Lunatimonas sp.]
MIDLDSVVAKLVSAMEQPLPGREGQMLMAPIPIDESRFGQVDNARVRRGAVLVLFYPGEAGCMVPFIKRPTYSGVHSGQVSLPGGKWDPEDEDLQITALRETYEEIGVPAAEITVFGSLSQLYIPPSNFSVLPFLGYTENKPRFRPDPHEVERLITCSFEYLASRDIRKKKPLQAGLQTLNAPYFDIDNEVVWGATAMILSELLFLWENY